MSSAGSSYRPASCRGRLAADAAGASFYSESQEEPDRTNSVPASEQSSADGATLDEFIDLAERQRSHFLWLARKVTDRSDDAEDIVQQAMLKAFRKLATFRGDSQLKTWLSAIVLNCAREYVRNQRARLYVPLDHATSDGDFEELEILDGHLNPEEEYRQYETDCMVVAAVGRLECTKRQIVEMCVFDELPYTQIAATLHLSLATIKSRMFRSRRDLRMSLFSRLGGFR